MLLKDQLKAKGDTFNITNIDFYTGFGKHKTKGKGKNKGKEKPKNKAIK